LIDHHIFQYFSVFLNKTRKNISYKNYTYHLNRNLAKPNMFKFKNKPLRTYRK
jgi:hypothetical protein